MCLLRLGFADVNGLTQRALELELLNEVPHFSCTYYPAELSGNTGQSAFEFADFGPNRVTLRFIFRCDGDVIISGCPNKWSNYKSTDILHGKASFPSNELLSFTLIQMPVLKETLHLYIETIPHNDYSPLLGLWDHIQPVIIDTQVEPHMPHPWWKLT